MICDLEVAGDCWGEVRPLVHDVLTPVRTYWCAFHRLEAERRIVELLR